VTIRTPPCCSACLSTTTKVLNTLDTVAPADVPTTHLSHTRLPLSAMKSTTTIITVLGVAGSAMVSTGL
jgi:hypothetical protein